MGSFIFQLKLTVYISILESLLIDSFLMNPPILNDQDENASEDEDTSEDDNPKFDLESLIFLLLFPFQHLILSVYSKNSKMDT
jgi:hypothetical protein